MSDSEQPYTTIETEGAVDICYLVYREKWLRLPPTQHAIVMSLLSDDGLDIAEVEEERLEIRNPYIATHKLAEFINPITFRTNLHKLRMKIKDCFGDELILPRVTNGNSSGRLRGLRLWTKEQLTILRHKLLNPGDGVFSIKDERMRWHIFVNGCEIKSARSSLALSCHIVEKASSKEGFKPNSEEFRTVYREITGRDREMAANSVSVILVFLRKALEEQAGMTLTRRKAGSHKGKEDQPIRLIQLDRA